MKNEFRLSIMHNISIIVWYILILMLFLIFSCSQSRKAYSKNSTVEKEKLDRSQYNYISEYSEGLATAYGKEKKFVIDSFGNVQFELEHPLKYIDFRFGYSIFIDGLYEGIIDKKGKKIVPAQYVDIVKFNQRFCKVKTKKYEYKIFDVYSKRTLEIDSLHPKAIPISSKLIANFKENRMGAIDIQGRTIIPYEYDRLSHHISDVITANKNSKYGIIDENNNVLVPFMYDDLKRIKGDQDLYIVAIGKKSGVVDQSNSIILPLEYDYLKQQKNGNIKFRKGSEKGYFDSDFNVVPSILQKSPYEFITLFEVDKKIGVKNIKGDIIHEAIFDDIRHTRYNISLVTKNRSYNVINRSGDLILDEYFDKVQVYNGFLLVRKDSKWGVITMSNKILIDLKYDKIELKDNVFYTKLNSKIGLYDYHGNQILEPKYNKIERHKNIIIANSLDSCSVLSRNFDTVYKGLGNINTSNQQHKDYLMILEKDNRMYIVDLMAKRKVLSGYNEIHELSHIRDVFKVSVSNNKVGLLHNNGELILDTIYNDFQSVLTTKKHFLAYSDHGVELYDHHANQLIAPLYDEIRMQNEDHIVVIKDNALGLIDIHGNQLLSHRYKRIRGKIQDYYVVAEDRNFGLVDSLEQLIIDYSYESIKEYAFPIVMVRINGLYGMLNVETKQQTEIIFKEIDYVTDRLVRIEKNGSYGIMSVKGEIVIPPICDKIKIERKKEEINSGRRYKTSVVYDSEIIKYKIKYKGIEFNLDPQFKCLTNCDRKDELQKLLLKSN